MSEAQVQLNSWVAGPVAPLVEVMNKLPGMVILDTHSGGCTKCDENSWAYVDFTVKKYWGDFDRTYDLMKHLLGWNPISFKLHEVKRWRRTIRRARFSVKPKMVNYATERLQNSINHTDWCQEKEG